MKIRKNLFKSFLFLSLILGIQPTFAEIQISDIQYNFDQTKLDLSKNSFHFMRSFVDYYYLIVKQNLNQLPEIQKMLETRGWCAGDAHPENFGYLYNDSNNSTQFTINDFDDSGDCPVFLDFNRLFLLSQLADKSTDKNLDNIMTAYVNGFKHPELEPKNDYLESLKQQSLDLGSTINSKNVINNKLVRKDETYEEITSDDQQRIIKVLNLHPLLFKSTSFQYLDAVKTSKQGGGSGGMERFEVLIKNNDQLLILELKQQQEMPSSYPFAVGFSDIKTRIFNSLKLFTQNSYSSFYEVVTLENKNYLVRPKFSGDVGLNLKDVALQEILPNLFFKLGELHARSTTDKTYTDKFTKLDTTEYLNEIHALSKFIDNKYKQLTHAQ